MRRRRVAARRVHGADARDELAEAERLDDVVVGAELEADDAVDLLAPRGHHDDRHVASARAARRQTSKPSMSGRRRSSRTRSGSAASSASAPVATRVDLEALAAQALDERLGDRVLVLDDQHLHAHIVACAARSRHPGFPEPCSPAATSLADRGSIARCLAQAYLGGITVPEVFDDEPIHALCNRRRPRRRGRRRRCRRDATTVQLGEPRPRRIRGACSRPGTHSSTASRRRCGAGAEAASLPALPKMPAGDGACDARRSRRHEWSTGAQLAIVVRTSTATTATSTDESEHEALEVEASTMTNHVARLYASRWRSSSSSSPGRRSPPSRGRRPDADPRLAALAAREQRLAPGRVLVQQVVGTRWAVYRVAAAPAAEAAIARARAAAATRRPLPRTSASRPGRHPARR